MKALAKRFYPKVAAPNADGCELWTASIDTRGYGHINVNGKPQRAHRVAWELAHGHVLDGLHVLHMCDVRSCCALKHLWLGTSKDNMRDMNAKNRAPNRKGARNGRSKITDGQVIAIRFDPRILRLISADYGVSMTQVSGIKRGTKWAHVQ